MPISKYKLVYSNWLTLADGSSLPVANGNYPEVYSWMQKMILENPDIRSHGSYDRINEFDAQFQLPDSGVVFRHINLYQNFCNFYGKENIVNLDQIDPLDNYVYFFPYEAEGQNINFFYSGFNFTINKQQIYYKFVETLTEKTYEYLKSGKLKVLISSLTEPNYGIDTINRIEKSFLNIGIDPSSINLLFGNCNLNYKGKILQATSHASLQQQAEIGLRYPIQASSLGYPCDYPKIHELDKTKLRSKKFLCWNRTMNRPHRLAIAYIAIKYNLLEDSTFSFLCNASPDIITNLRHLVNDDRNELGAIANKIKEMLPYEVDTQDLTPEGKEGFQTNENNKKEIYENTYLHIISETCFDSTGTPFMSEKTFRPMLNLQPFIYIGNYRALEELRRLGFKTFEGFIDESYDLEPDPKKRFEMIVDEIKKFASMSIQEIHTWYYSLTDILEHNQRHFLTLDKLDPLKELFEKY